MPNTTLSKKKIKERILARIPYPSHISDWDIKTEKNGVRFTWRNTRFQVISDRFGFMRVHMVLEDGHGLESNNMSILLEAILLFEATAILTSRT